MPSASEVPLYSPLKLSGSSCNTYRNPDVEAFSRRPSPLPKS
jgi:hypothetical protein